MLERLQKLISQAGITSRRAAEELILAGRVTVNGIVVTELGSKADPAHDRICVDGKPVKPVETKMYILLNKPAGFMTTLDDPEGTAGGDGPTTGDKTARLPGGTTGLQYRGPATAH